MEGFHSPERSVLFVVSSSFFGILHCQVVVWLVVCILWKIPTPDCQHASDGCWLKALIEFQGSGDTWLAPAGALRWCNRVAKQSRNISVECVYSGARYDCYKVVFVFATILARTCIACCLRNSFDSAALILRSSSPWTHQNQQFPNRRHRFHWSCRPNRHSLAYRPERPRFLSVCWWWCNRYPRDRTFWRLP